MCDVVRIVEVGPRDGLQNETGRHRHGDQQDRTDRPVVRGPACAASEATSLRQPQVGCRRWPMPPKYYTGITKASRRIALSGAGAERTGLRTRAGRRRGREVAVFTAASEAFNLRNTNATIAQSLDRFAAGAGARQCGWRRACVAMSPPCLAVPTRARCRWPMSCAWPPALHAMGCYEVSLGDTIGVGTPAKAAGDAEARWPAEVPMPALAIHFHDTYGQALANVLACLEEGVRSGRQPRSPVPEAARTPKVRQRQRGQRGRGLHAAWPRHPYRHRPRPHSAPPSVVGWPACWGATPVAARSHWQGPWPRNDRTLPSDAVAIPYCWEPATDAACGRWRKRW